MEMSYGRLCVSNITYWMLKFVHSSGTALLPYKCLYFVYSVLSGTNTESDCDFSPSIFCSSKIRFLVKAAFLNYFFKKVIYLVCKFFLKVPLDVTVFSGLL